jgi:hypothetical protein
MKRRTPIFIVTSPRQRVGKTLVARTLAEFFHADGRSVAAFDVNPDQFSLVEYLPADTAVASVEDTRGQMALFDQLVQPDGVPKVVDLGHSQFDRFFTVMQDIGFAREAHVNAIVPTVLFVCDQDVRSRQGYAMLRDRFPDLALVPVFNEGIGPTMRYRTKFPQTRLGGAPLTIPSLSGVVRQVTERPGFSFASYSFNATDTTTELYGWTKRVFLEFRDLELRLLLEELKPSLTFDRQRFP